MIETEGSKYELTRKAFLDVVWNRFEVVEFLPFKGTGEINLHPYAKDRFGRVKVCLIINPLRQPEKQAKTLIHEAVHVDRGVWEKFNNNFGPQFWKIKREEEQLAISVAESFYTQNQDLAKKALYHVWLKSLS